MLFRSEFDTIYHEHLSFYNIKSAKALVQRAGMNLIDVLQHPIHGTSYIFVISRDRDETPRIKSLIDEEAIKGLYDPKTYTDYAEKCHLVAEMFAKTIREYRERGIRVVGYGAPAKGNTLMNFAEEGPDFIIDENPLKQLMFTPGLGVPIQPPGYLTMNYFETHPVCFVPLAWNFYDEIVSKIRTMRPSHTHHDIFVRYFPRFEVHND